MMARAPQHSAIVAAKRAGMAADLADDWLLTGTHGFQLVEPWMGVSGDETGWREGDCGMNPD
jgi:hypothetical protein